MLEDQVQIIETTGAAHPPPGIDVIISVLNNVPSSLYLDAIYIFRVRSAPLNAQRNYSPRDY